MRITVKKKLSVPKSVNHKYENLGVFSTIIILVSIFAMYKMEVLRCSINYYYYYYYNRFTTLCPGLPR